MTCATPSLRKKAAAISTAALAHFAGEESKPLSGLRIGLPVQCHAPAPFAQVPRSLLSYLISLGATMVPLDVPHARVALPAYYVIACAEASSNFGRFGGGWYGSSWESESEPASVPASERSESAGEAIEASEARGETGDERRRRIRTRGFGPEVQKRILAGTHALSADEFNNTYLKALHIRRLIRQEFANGLRIPHPAQAHPDPPPDGVDILLHPTAIRTAPLLFNDPAPEQSGYLQDLLTTPSSLAGLPSMSVPAGKGRDGWPLGVALVGQWGMEEVLFYAGAHVEKWSEGRRE